VHARGDEVDDLPKPEEPPGFETIFRLYYARIARLIARLVGDRAAAEELATEVFWTYWRNPPREEGNAGGWLYRTATNRGLYELRRRARHARYQRFFHIGSPPSTPEQLHASTEEQEHVRQVLAAMKPREAELLLLRGNGFSYEEVASILRLKPGSIGTLIRRAQETFRKEYTRLYGEPRNGN
jgi:RNA polymerase sigma-70 factor (ECF subfamily)